MNTLQTRLLALADDCEAHDRDGFVKRHDILAIASLAREAAAALAGRGEWLPIESAPKVDRIAILAMTDKGITSVEWEGFGDEEQGRWVLHAPSDYPGDNTIYPTHWMPLPAEPEAQAGER